MTTDRFKPVRVHLAKARGHLAGVKPADELKVRITTVSNQLTVGHEDWHGDAKLARDQLALVTGELEKRHGAKQFVATRVRSKNETVRPNKLPLSGVAAAIDQIDKALTTLKAWCEQ
jgi:hypothetical protein